MVPEYQNPQVYTQLLALAGPKPSYSKERKLAWNRMQL
jgi:hypothetical protein